MLVNVAVSLAQECQWPLLIEKLVLENQTLCFRA
jgi:hypothetical protein